MGKNIFRTSLFIICAVLCLGFNCFASDVNTVGDVTGSEGDNARTETEQNGGTDAGTVGEISANDSGTVSESSVKVRNLVFYPVDSIVEGSATNTDIYNVLAGIHNLLIIKIFIDLIMWAYKIITETYRRFLKNV